MTRSHLNLVGADSPVSRIMRFPVAAVESDASLFEAAEVMVANDIGAVAVLRHDVLVGVLSERDLAAQITAGADMHHTSVVAVMSGDLVTVHPEETVVSAAQRANAALIRHLPVVGDDGEVIGFISVRDLLEVLVSALG